MLLCFNCGVVPVAPGFAQVRVSPWSAPAVLDDAAHARESQALEQPVKYWIALSKGDAGEVHRATDYFPDCLPGGIKRPKAEL